MNEAERIENLVKRLEKITDDFISVFPENRNRQLSRSSRNIHRVKDYLNDVKNKVIDGEITPSFETTLDKIESVIEMTKSGSIKTLTGAPVYGKDTASLMKDIAKDIKEEQKAVKREARNKYKDMPLKYEPSLVDEIDATIKEMEQTQEQTQKDNEIENTININISNKSTRELIKEISELKETIQRVKLEIDLIENDDSLDAQQKHNRIKPKKEELQELKGNLRILNSTKSISDVINQIRKVQSTINRIGLEIDLVEKDPNLSDEEKVARIAPKDEELYRLKSKLKRLRDVLNKHKEYMNIKESVTNIPESDFIKNSKRNLQKILDEIEELTGERDALEKEIPLLKEDSYSPDSVVYDDVIRRAIKEKEDRLETVRKLIALKRETYSREYIAERREMNHNTLNKLDAIQAEIDLLSQDIVQPVDLVRALKDSNPNNDFRAINFDTLAVDTDIKKLNLPNGFYISGNRITNKDTAIGNLYLNMLVVPLIKKEQPVIHEEIINTVQPKEESLIEKEKTKEDYNEYKKEAYNEYIPNEILDNNEIDINHKLSTDKELLEEKEEPIEELNDNEETIERPVIAVSSIEEAKRNKARTYNEINQIKGNLEKHKQEIKELKTKIKKTKDRKEKAKLKKDLDKLVKKYADKDAKLKETKKIKEKAIDNYDDFIDRYEGVKNIVRELRNYVESMDSEIDYDYCLAKQQEIIKLRGENNKYIPKGVLLEIANELDCEKERLDDETINGVIEILAEGPPRPEKKGKITKNQAVAAVTGVALLGGGAVYGLSRVKKSIDEKADANLELSKPAIEQRIDKNEEKETKKTKEEKQEFHVPPIEETKQEEKTVVTQENKSKSEKQNKKEEITDAGTKADPVHESSGFEPQVDTSKGVSDGGTSGDPNVEGEDITDTSKYNGEVTDGGTTEDPIYSDDNEAIIEENTEEELPEEETIIEEEAPDIEPVTEDEEKTEEAPDIDPVTEEEPEVTEEESPQEEEEVIDVEDLTPEENTIPDESEEEKEVQPLTQEQIDAFDEEDVVEAFVNKGTTKGGINLNNISAEDKKALIDRSLEISAENYDIPTGTPAPWESDVLDVYFDEELYSLDSKTK